jgi:His/Glu/Gln/Arg/opine family amino acid ABC transporter permease subunit
MQALIKSRKYRNAAIQITFLATLVLILVLAVVIGKANLDAQGITSGFSFLKRSTGFDVGFSLIEFGPNDTYGKMLWVGLLNTIFLGIIGIFLANVLGMAVAVLRISKNGMLNVIGTLYIEIFRNVPLILQTFLWYALLIHLPRPKQSYALFDTVFLSARGLYFPGLNVTGLSAIFFFVFLIGGLIILFWYSSSRRFTKVAQTTRTRVKRTTLVFSVLCAIAVLIVGRIPDTTLISVPHLKGLNFRGGIRIPPELSALAIAMAIYGGAYMAEIIRAGFLSVSKGKTEAAQALGLSPWHVFSRVRLPLAIRAILPTLSNQYVWRLKATTLGIAIGFTDFFSVASVSINQSGQTLELIGILMLGFLVMNNTMSFVLNHVNKAIEIKGSN